METWNDEIIKILNNVRVNSLNLSEYHRRNYFSYRELSKWFDVPIIITSTLAGSFSVGASPYMDQGTISVVSCAASMFITILSSIKLYLNISDNLQSESDMARKFYVLSLEIYKIINLPDEKRGINSSDFLNAKYNQYIKLYEESNLLKRRYKKDQLAKMDESLLLSDNNSNGSSSCNGTTNIIVNDNDSL
jgi:hypothetical protein